MLFPNYEYADLPPSEIHPIRNGHLDIKDAQCARKNDGRKTSYHIISRIGATAVKKGRFRHPKIRLFSKVSKFAVYIRIDMALFIHE